jgi:hypothetical protein
MQAREARPRSAKLARSQSLSSERKITEFVKPAAHVRKLQKMATGTGEIEKEVTTSELKTLMQTLIQNLQTDMNSNFTKLSADIGKLTTRLERTEEKTEKIESDISTLNFDMAELTDAVKGLNDLSEIDIPTILRNLQERIKYLERAELENAVHSRKYNLMLHGIRGNENDNELTEEKVRNLIGGELELGEKYANSVSIANCHRLPKPKNSTWGNRGDPDPVVVKFVKWSDRERVLRSARNLKKESKIRIRTHLPAPLAKARAKLSTTAYNKRQEGLHARVRERGATVVMDTRDGHSSAWKTAETISMDQVIEFRIGGCKSLDSL